MSDHLTQMAGLSQSHSQSLSPLGERWAEAALAVSTDPEHRFELAVTLKRLDVAHAIATQTEHPHKWRQLSELALRDWNVDLAVSCMSKADDLSGLLLVHSATGNADALTAHGWSLSLCQNPGY